MIAALTLLALVPAPSDVAYEAALVAAVHHFAREGNLPHLSAILDKHPHLVDAKESFPPGHKPLATEGYNPLDWAAAGGHVAVADYLIRRGAKVNAADGSGWTPLHLAAQRGHLGVVKLLVERGADLEARTEAFPETTSDSLPGQAASPGGAERPMRYAGIPSRTPLDWAREMKRAEVVRYLQTLEK